MDETDQPTLPATAQVVDRARPWRVWVLPMAAVVIVGLCTWRMTRPPRPRLVMVAGTQQAYPPRGWELYDQHRHLAKIDRYLGRQALLVRFVGDAAELRDDPLLLWLRDHYAEVRRAGLEVLAITTARPSEVDRVEQAVGEPWPFPVLSDLYERDPTPAPVHRLWGCLDPDTDEVRPGLFHVDRKGYVAYAGGRPEGLPQTVETLARLIR